MEDMDKITADILKAINELKKSGIIEEIVSLPDADRQEPLNCPSPPEQAGTPGGDDTSAT